MIQIHEFTITMMMMIRLLYSYYNKRNRLGVPLWLNLGYYLFKNLFVEELNNYIDSNGFLPNHDYLCYEYDCKSQMNLVMQDFVFYEINFYLITYNSWKWNLIFQKLFHIFAGLASDTLLNYRWTCWENSKKWLMHFQITLVLSMQLTKSQDNKASNYRQ